MFLKFKLTQLLSNYIDVTDSLRPALTGRLANSAISPLFYSIAISEAISDSFKALSRIFRGRGKLRFWDPCGHCFLFILRTQASRDYTFLGKWMCQKNDLKPSLDLYETFLKEGVLGFDSKATRSC